jgi:hypothetical protein
MRFATRSSRSPLYGHALGAGLAIFACSCLPLVRGVAPFAPLPRAVGGAWLALACAVAVEPSATGALLLLLLAGWAVLRVARSRSPSSALARAALRRRPQARRRPREIASREPPARRPPEARALWSHLVPSAHGRLRPDPPAAREPRPPRALGGAGGQSPRDA